MGVSVAASSVVMFSLGALTASLVCWLWRSKKATKNKTSRGPSPAEERSEFHANIRGVET